MPTVRGPKSLTRNFQRHSGISSSQATSSISSICVVSSAELEDLALVGDREGDLVLHHVSLGLVRGLTPNGAECDDSVTPHDRTPLLRRPRCGPRRGAPPSTGS